MVSRRYTLAVKLSTQGTGVTLSSISVSKKQIISSVFLKGPRGFQGAGGDSAYQVWLNQGNVGTEADFLLSLKGDPGDVTSGVSSVNALTGAVVLDADDIDDTTTINKFVSAANIAKIDSVESGAEANNITDLNATDLTDGTDSTLHFHASDRSRVNHTGEQAISTVTGLQAALDSKSTTTHAHAVNDLSDVTIVTPTSGQVLKFNGTAWINDTDATGGGGTNATNLSASTTTTAVTVASDTGTDAIISASTSTAAGVMTSADRTKLDGVATGATANSSDATLLARANHTGTQAASTITGLATVATSGSYNDLLNKPDLTALNDVQSYVNLAGFPATGTTDHVYIAEDTGYLYRWNGTSYTQLTDQTAIWGQVSGTLANQTDLQNALNGKVDDAQIANFETTTQLNARDTANRNTDNHVSGTTNKVFTATEQTKLTGIEAGAQVNAVTSVATKTGAVTLVKADVGLANVDNTSDVSKPVSTAQQTALDAKLNASVISTNGKGSARHLADANFPRPTGFASIEWLGSVEPLNATTADTWLDTA